MPLTGGEAAPEVRMKRVILAITVAALAVLVVPATRNVRAAGGVCAQMTAAKLLESSELGSAYADALRAGDAGEIGRIEDAIKQIRSVHGCEGDVALPAAPLGHPALPPGHPPIDRRSFGERGPSIPLFGAPQPVTI
jgi:hypothetical protein